MNMIRLLCNLTIHLAQAVLDTLDSRRPMMDKPLVNGLDEVYTGPFEDCSLSWPPPDRASLTTGVVGSERFSGVGTPPAGMGRHG